MKRKVCRGGVASPLEIRPHQSRAYRANESNGRENERGNRSFGNAGNKIKRKAADDETESEKRLKNVEE
jgi:hypothetical protein